MSQTVVFDIETDGLLYEGRKAWCMTTYDKEKDETLVWNEDEIKDGCSYLYNADFIIGHNICGFDIPFLEINYYWPGVFNRNKCRDTYIMSKLMYPERSQGHGLDKWAPMFLREKIEHHDWSQFSKEMVKRNMEDVKINNDLYDYLFPRLSKANMINAMLIEQEMHYWQAYQEFYGVDVDVEKAHELVEQIDKEIKTIDKRLHNELPMRVVQVGPEVKRPFKKDGTYTKQVRSWFEEKN